MLLPDVVAYCVDDNQPVLWFHSQKNLVEILQERLNIRSPHYWKAHLAYYRSFLGVMGIVFYIFDVWVKMFLIIIVRKFSLIAKHK